MKYTIHAIAITLCTLILCNCKPQEKKEATMPVNDLSDCVDTLIGDVPTPIINDIIQYSGAINDSIKIALETFSPLTLVHSLASRSIHIKDSLEAVRETQQLTDPKDSLIFTPYESQAYQAILAYKQSMAAGIQLQVPCPSLLQLNRMVDTEDSSSSVLPEVKKSGFLAHGNFFFLGGAPFIYKLYPEENTVYTDPRGNPETRFESSITENANYLLNSVYHFKKERINVTFGPPLGSYDSGPQEVKGIGSLNHEFVNRIPVFFLTEGGIVPAHLIAVNIKIIPESLGCISDQPTITFACAKSLEQHDILGIYIPYNTTPVTTCAVSRKDNTLWTADINGDGIADIACVTGSFEGIGGGDALAEALWFVNIQGNWIIIDGAQDLDCT